MISVIETKDGFAPIAGNPTLDSLDGETRAPLAVVLANSWTAEDRAKFGVYLVEPMEIPEGKEVVGMPRYERDKTGKVVQVRDLEDVKTPEPLSPQERLERFLQAVGLTIDELKALLR
jgi:hypothetical protein